MQTYKNTLVRLKTSFRTSWTSLNIWPSKLFKLTINAVKHFIYILITFLDKCESLDTLFNFKVLEIIILDERIMNLRIVNNKPITSTFNFITKFFKNNLENHNFLRLQINLPSQKLEK